MCNGLNEVSNSNTTQKNDLKTTTILILLVLLSTLYSCKQSTRESKSDQVTVGTTDKNNLQNGDLIFQTSLSSQSKAIQLATQSVYSHCGMVFQNGADYFVLEAIQPVTVTPLKKWIDRGKDKHFVVKRLKNSERVLTTAVLQKMKTIGQNYIGKDYDLSFEWSDDKLYCSELIWKIYHQAAGVELGKLQRLHDFDLSHPAVKKKLQERYGKTIPKEETVISPQAVFESELLETVASN